MQMKHLGTQRLETERLILRPFVVEDAEAMYRNRVASWHDPRNPNSGKVMQKCGMKYEGMLRSADRNNQGICDAACYGLLKEDWLTAKLQLVKL